MVTQESVLAGLADLLQAEQAGAAGVGITSRELAQTMGLLDLRHSLRLKLRGLIEEGLVEASKGVRRNVVGDPYRPPVYRLTEKGLQVLQELKTSHVGRPSTVQTVQEG